MARDSRGVCMRKSAKIRGANSITQGEGKMGLRPGEPPSQSANRPQRSEQAEGSGGQAIRRAVGPFHHTSIYSYAECFTISLRMKLFK